VSLDTQQKKIAIFQQLVDAFDNLYNI